jgi:hypothetical protein
MTQTTQGTTTGQHIDAKNVVARGTDVGRGAALGAGLAIQTAPRSGADVRGCTDDYVPPPCHPNTSPAAHHHRRRRHHHPTWTRTDIGVGIR